MGAGAAKVNMGLRDFSLLRTGCGGAKPEGLYLGQLSNCCDDNQCEGAGTREPVTYSKMGDWGWRAKTGRGRLGGVCSSYPPAPFLCMSILEHRLLAVDASPCLPVLPSVVP